MGASAENELKKKETMKRRRKKEEMCLTFNEFEVCTPSCFNMCTAFFFLLFFKYIFSIKACAKVFVARGNV